VVAQTSLRSVGQSVNKVTSRLEQLIVFGSHDQILSRTENAHAVNCNSVRTKRSQTSKGSKLVFNAASRTAKTKQIPRPLVLCMPRLITKQTKSSLIACNASSHHDFLWRWVITDFNHSVALFLAVSRLPRLPQSIQASSYVATDKTNASLPENWCFASQRKRQFVQNNTSRPTVKNHRF